MFLLLSGVVGILASSITGREGVVAAPSTKPELDATFFGSLTRYKNVLVFLDAVMQTYDPMDFRYSVMPSTKIRIP